MSEETYKIHPTPDLDSPTGVYIPNNLEEAIVELERMIPVPLKLKLEIDAIAKYHLSLGLWLRNNWCLGQNNNLVQYFVNYGASSQADTISTLLLTLYQRYLQRPLADAEENLTDVDLFKFVNETYRRLIGCDRATLWILDSLKNELVTKVNLPEKAQDIRIPTNASYMGKVLESCESLNLPFDFYFYHNSENIKQLDLKLGYRHCSILVMPVQETDGTIMGVIQLINKKKPSVFSSYDPANYPQPPECWQASFTKDDITLLERRNQQLVTLLNRY